MEKNLNPLGGGRVLRLYGCNFMPQFHLVERHQEFDAIDDEADNELEPDKQGKQAEERAIGNAHAGDKRHAPAVNAGHGQPENGD